MENSEKTRLPDLFTVIVNSKPAFIDNPPEELVTFRKLAFSVRREEGKSFFRQGFIEEYLNKKWRAELHNMDCFLWLYGLYEKEIDSNKKHALEVKLTEFQNVIMHQDHSFPALMINFRDYPFRACGKYAQAMEDLNAGI